MSNELVNILNDSQLEQSSSDLILSHFSEFDAQTAEWMDKAKTLVVADESETGKMKDARDARLALKDLRVAADKKRKQLKEEGLRYNQAVQSVYNHIEGKVRPIEAYLKTQEDFAKIQEQKRMEEEKAAIDALRSKRETLVEDLREFVGYGDDFGLMSEGAFNAVMNDAKAKQAAKIKAEQEEQAARELAEKQRAEEDARIRAENARLHAEKEAQEAAMMRERELAAAEQRKIEEKARIEREAAQKAQREAQAEIDRIKAEEQARIEQEAADVLARQREEQEAKRKAESASDKVKVNAYLTSLKSITAPEVQSEDAKRIITDLSNSFYDADASAESL